jgi:hypothetical protein
MKKLKLLLIVSGGLIAFLSATWAYMFYRMIKAGKYLFVIESDKVILYSEFILAIIFVIVGIVIFLYPNIEARK